MELNFFIGILIAFVYNNFNSTLLPDLSEFILKGKTTPEKND